MPVPIPSVYLLIEENPNCAPLDGLIFQPRTVPAAIDRVRCEHRGTVDWYEVTGLGADGSQVPANACRIDDSGEGACYLVTGGDWGLRFRTPGTVWNMDDPVQWGEPYLLLPADEAGLSFCPSTQS